MNIEDLDFSYPEKLVALERDSSSRVMRVSGDKIAELDGISALLEEFEAGDLLVLNDSRVLRRRVFTESSNLEILFLAPADTERTLWRVLCPSSRWKEGVQEILPASARLDLIERGRTQLVRSSIPLDEVFFEKHGEMPLPPYIQKARKERHNRLEDVHQYQTAWARKDGSLAAPTASLHFSQEQLEVIIQKNVRVEMLTLHVGLGTFMPITVSDLSEHVMHAEAVWISKKTWQSVLDTKKRGGRVWALGTTVARSLESVAHGLLDETPHEGFVGETSLFIKPGFEWRVVDVLMTNFHQPKSTLLALVASFAGLKTVKTAYSWAIEREFRLFSYGDLSVWSR